MSVEEDLKWFRWRTLVVGISNWLGVLAMPHQFRTLQRSVDPAHLTRLMDIWIAYVEAEPGDRRWVGKFAPIPDGEPADLARRMRALLVAWTPPELPADITETARAMLHVQGIKRNDAAEWDAFTFDLEGHPLEDMLVWPESELMPKEAGDA
jgi:hypothetical protein